MSQVEVSFVAGEPPRVIRVPGAMKAVHDWTLRELNPAP
jgi:hypothetical protein